MRRGILVLLVILAWVSVYSYDRKEMEYVLSRHAGQYVNTARFVKVIHMLYGDSILRLAYDKELYCRLEITVDSDFKLMDMVVEPSRFYKYRKNEFLDFVDEHKMEIYKAVLAVYGEIFVDVFGSYDSIFKRIRDYGEITVAIQLPVFSSSGFYPLKFDGFMKQFNDYEYYPVETINAINGIYRKD